MLNMATKILGHWEPTDRKLLGSNNPLIASILHGMFYSIKKIFTEHVRAGTIAFKLHEDPSGRQDRYLQDHVTEATK